MKKAVPMLLAIAVMAICFPLDPKSASAQEEKAKESATREQKPVAAYRIEFSVREIEDGKRLNSRNYMMMAEEGNWAKIRVGNRVPFQTAEKQYQYTNVGFSIDCRPHEQEGGVALAIIVDFSSVAPQSEAAPSFNPMFRSNRTEVQPIVALGKPTVVTSMDDVESNRRYEIEVTATKVK